jgi:hypothetical protein
LVVIKGELLQQRAWQLVGAVAVLAAQVVHLGAALVVGGQEAGYLWQRVAVQHCRKATQTQKSRHQLER